MQSQFRLCLSLMDATATPLQIQLNYQLVIKRAGKTILSPSMHHLHLVFVVNLIGLINDRAFKCETIAWLLIDE